MLGIVRSAGSVGVDFAAPLLRAFFLPLPHRPPFPVPVPVPLPLVTGASGVDVPSPLGRLCCSSPLLVWLLFARFLLCGLDIPADVGASPRCFVYWLFPSFLTFRPATFFGGAFSCVARGGLSGCEEGGGDVWLFVLGFGVSSGSSVTCQRSSLKALIFAVNSYHLVFSVLLALDVAQQLLLALFRAHCLFHVVLIVARS